VRCRKSGPQGLLDRKAGNSSACAQLAHPGRGHRPCHSATVILGPPGAQSPRPAPAPPLAGASRPPGRALAFVAPGPADLRGTVAHGRGNACVSCSRPEGRCLSPGQDCFPGRRAVGLLVQHPVSAVPFFLTGGVIRAAALATEGLPRSAARAPWRYGVRGGLPAISFVAMFEGLKSVPRSRRPQSLP
jgi:hypothetical protein